MKHSVKITAIAACLLGMAGLAQADSVSDSGLVRVTVQGTCSIQPISDKVLDMTGATMISQSFPVLVLCSDQLPYTLALDTEAGGFFNVTDSNTNRTYQVKFTKDDNTGWGSVANGDEFVSAGTGQYQTHQFNVSFNADNAYTNKPQVGSYVGAPTATLSFF